MRLRDKALQLLEASGRSQKDFADAIGASPQTLNGWIKKGRDPSPEYIIPICLFFGISPNELFEYDAATVGLDERERNLVEHFRALDLDGKARVESAAANEHDRVRLEGDSEKTAI